MKRLAYFSVLYAGSAGLLRALGFVASLWLARTLAPESYAAWGLLYACQTGVVTFGLVGIQEAVVGLLKHHRSAAKRERLYAAATAVFRRTTGITVLVAAAVGLAYLVPERSGVAGLIGVLASGVLLAHSTLQAQLLRLQEDHTGSLGFSFTAPMCGLAGSLAAFALRPSVTAFFVGSVAGLAAAMVFLRRRGAGTSPVRADRIVRLQLLRRLAPFVVVAFLGWLSGYGNNFVVDRWFDATDVARLTFALSIGSVAQLVASALNQVWSPRFYALTRQMPFDEVERRNRRIFNTMGLVLGVIAAVCIAALPPLLRAAGGHLAGYASMRLELFFVLAGYIVLTPWWHCQNYFLAYDKGAAVLRVVLLTSFVGIVAWLLMMWWLGPMGIYVGFFVQMVLRSAGIVLHARRWWAVQVGWAGSLAGIALPVALLWITGV